MAVAAREPGDETLAAQAVAGDGHAFEQLVSRYDARVFRLACRLTSETDAPDVLQDTFLQVHRRLSSFRGESKFGTWLYRIATNAALMRSIASSRPICVVTWMTRSFGATSIIETSGVWVSAASSSV